MLELQWSLGWTLASIAVCWLALSCVVALSIGQIIRRGKPRQERPATDATSVSSAYADVAPSDDELADLDASRAASGTRLKPIRLSSDRDERKVS
jgi:hypothetical protein